MAPPVIALSLSSALAYPPALEPVSGVAYASLGVVLLAAAAASLDCPFIPKKLLGLGRSRPSNASSSSSRSGGTGTPAAVILVAGSRIGLPFACGPAPGGGGRGSRLEAKGIVFGPPETGAGGEAYALALENGTLWDVCAAAVGPGVRYRSAEELGG